MGVGCARDLPGSMISLAFAGALWYFPRFLCLIGRCSMAGAPFQSYSEALDFLSEFTNYEKRPLRPASGPKLGVDRVAGLLAAVGDPHKRLRSVHIAGTKGKGSTAAMVEHLLRRSGASVGVYTSPHVDCERERIRVDGEWISEEQAAEMLGVMHPYLCGTMQTPKTYRPTFFEIFTAMAFLHFERERVDWSVTEVGLGGRLDATNVLAPAVCAITPVSFDHTELLGDTLGKIAGEKAGILKPGVPAVVSQQEPEAAEVILARAAELGCPVRRVGEDIELAGDGGGTFTVSTWRGVYRGLHCAMPGRHQQENAAMAIGVIEVLRDLGAVSIGEDDIRSALAEARLPGRIEVLSERPAMIVDVAHNPASMRALLNTIGRSFPHERLIAVFGCAADKDVRAMLAILAPHADRMIVAAIASPRALAADELARIAGEAGCPNVETAQDVHAAVRLALDSAGPEDIVCAAGSFYLAGDARRAWSDWSERCTQQAAKA